MIRFPLLAVPLALAACGDPAPAPKAVTTPQPGGYIQQVLALPQGQVRGVLFRAIRDGGKSCPKLDSFTRVADDAGKPVWTATCSDRGQWRITLDDTGTALVTGSAPA
jgi:hypothetical protein